MITSTGNQKVKEIIQLQKKSRARNQAGIFLVEGLRMIQEVPKDRLEKLYVSEGFYQKYRAELEAEGFTERTGIELVSDHVFAAMSDTKTPQGVLGIVRRAEYTAETLMGQAAPFLMVLDNLQDPGNLGTIFRTAEAAGVTGIVMSRDCVDIYNPKTIRSTMGAIYRMPFLIAENLPGMIRQLKKKDRRVCRTFGRKEHLRSGRLCRRLRVSDRKRGQRTAAGSGGLCRHLDPDPDGGAGGIAERRGGVGSSDVRGEQTAQIESGGRRIVERQIHFRTELWSCIAERMAGWRRYMEPVLDLTKEYGIVLDGGGARGAYQIGAWKALKEAGVKINAVAGTSVGALNGALICMDDVENAVRIWSELTFSRVMDVDDAWMTRLFDGEIPLGEAFGEVWKVLGEGGVDITPLKNLIHEMIDEKKIRSSGKEFCILTFSLSEMEEKDLSLEEIPEGLLEDFLLASAYLFGFKNEKLHGKRYIDGGVVNNVPVNSLIERGYKDLIEIRIYGPGREPSFELPEDGELYRIGARVDLGNIIEFDGKRSRQNLKIGYFDAKRLIYGLDGYMYYLEQTHEEAWYERRMRVLGELEKAEIRFVLKLRPGCSDKELLIAMLEASAKLLRVPKYQIYTVDEFWRQVYRRYESLEDPKHLPKFTHTLMKMGRENTMDLKGRNFLTLKDFTPEEILYLLDLAADLKEKKKNGIPVDHYKGKKYRAYL